jgi:gliding motility-associated-like protein
LNNSEFTLDFYISLEDIGENLYDILSFRLRCNLDSMLTIKYLPTSREVLVELARSPASFRTMRGRLNRDLCWNRITLVRNALQYSLYLDNQRVAFVNMPEEVPLDPNANLAFASSPCNETRFQGRIDELRIFTRPISGVELVQDYLYPDQIINRDTTIFRGGIVDVNIGASCAQGIFWQPLEGVENPMEGNTNITPENTTTYTLSFPDGNCVARDEMTIYVVDEDDIDCNNLLLPNVFTPNNDGLNDTYGISNTFIVDEISEYRIIDRSGSVLFSGMDKNDRWDGTFMNAPMHPDTYLYRIAYSCKGQNFTKTGTFIILK